MSKELGVFWINPAVHPLPITRNLKLCVTAENSTSVSTLRRLARNKEWNVRALVACNQPDTCIGAAKAHNGQARRCSEVSHLQPGCEVEEGMSKLNDWLWRDLAMDHYKSIQKITAMARAKLMHIKKVGRRGLMVAALS